MTAARAAKDLGTALRAVADREFAERTQRFFPTRIAALGVRNATVVTLARNYFAVHPDISPSTRLLIADRIIEQATHHEEVLLGFAVLHKVAKRQLGPELLERCHVWLNESVSNWAQCDDMCLKLLYPFLLGHLELIPRTQTWIDSASPWSRRAANVAVVKFVRGEVGGNGYMLPVAHVLDNCTRLMHDPDDYVQKGCGWLLKVTAQAHPEAVIDFLRAWRSEMNRGTYRYAIEKLSTDDRAALMGLADESLR